MALVCHSKRSGNVQTVDGDDAKSVQEFGDCVGDKQLLANSYMVVTVTVTHI